MMLEMRFGSRTDWIAAKTAAKTATWMDVSLAHSMAGLMADC